MYKLAMTNLSSHRHACVHVSLVEAGLSRPRGQYLLVSTEFGAGASRPPAPLCSFETSFPGGLQANVTFHLRSRTYQPLLSRDSSRITFPTRVNRNNLQLSRRTLRIGRESWLVFIRDGKVIEESIYDDMLRDLV